MKRNATIRQKKVVTKLRTKTVRSLNLYSDIKNLIFQPLMLLDVFKSSVDVNEKSVEPECKLPTDLVSKFEELRKRRDPLQAQLGKLKADASRLNKRLRKIVYSNWL